MNARTGFLQAVSVALLLAALSAAPAPIQAQVELRPGIGLQSIVFSPNSPAHSPISPGNDVDEPFGGGLASPNNAIHLQLEIIPSVEDVLRFPIILEYYDFDGKTTFAVPSQADRRIQQLRLRYRANMLSVGAGVTASFFAGPTLYVSGEARVNYIPPTLLTSRMFYLDTDELVVPERSIRPDSKAQTRIGGVLRIGSELDFFDPLLIDINIGFGAVNLLGKNSDSTTQRNLLTAEPTLPSPEQTLTFATVGLGFIWAF